MDTSLNYNILVAEEYSIVNYEIQYQLKKNGFGIIEKGGKEDILTLIQNKSPDITITSHGFLKKFSSGVDLNKVLALGNGILENSDTIIFDKEMQPLISYPKPFDSKDIINFIRQYFNK